ncbi:MAG TPA: ATP-binding protein, partial [Cyclobacteriaceae bacterium]
HEILVQNEEIKAQNEEMSARNEQLINQQNEIEKQHKELSDQNIRLKEAHRTIESQNKVIRQKNEELVAEVNHQTQDLRETNSELIEQNSRLEQFTFIISHNLRAPMARLVGLSSLLNLSKEEEEKTNIIDLMVRSTSELDNVIKDLSLILGIQKLSTQVYSEIKLSELVHKTVKMLEQDIEETQAEVTTELAIDTIYSLPQYIESILYNLISNAIKYRHPGEKPVVKIKSEIKDNRVVLRVSDKGLGIDVDKHRNNLFNLYKRFHFHVEGKGLGLYLVKTQIESLGGAISVESEVGQGTTFIVSIPLT